MTTIRLHRTANAAAIQAAFPGSSASTRGNVVTWHGPGECPTAEALETAHDDHAAAVRVAAVKAEARRRIVSRYPDWKQANMTARGLELVSLGVNITADEAAEMDALRAAWSWIKSVRAASDAIEVRLAEQPDLDIAAAPLWPAG